MNNTTQKIRIDSATATLGQDGKLVLQGSCSFQFFDRGQVQAKPLPFATTGNTAVVLQEAGLGAVAIAIGYIQIDSVEVNGGHIQAPCFYVRSAISVRNGSEPIEIERGSTPNAVTDPKISPEEIQF